MNHRTIWLVWEIQILNVGKDKVQLQELRVIASSKKNAELYKKAFEEDRHVYPLDDEENTWFIIESRELNHALGWQDLNRYISRNRN